MIYTRWRREREQTQAWQRVLDRLALLVDTRTWRAREPDEDARHAALSWT